MEKKIRQKKQSKFHKADSSSKGWKRSSKRDDNPSKTPHTSSSDVQSSSESKTSMLRKKVDPETAKYFAEISNLFDSNSIDLEDRSTICSNALDETRGKELELATDPIISLTLQIILEGCDVDHLCGFLRNCTKVFSSIAIDRFGSHVLESALKSLAIHVQDGESHGLTEDALKKTCKAAVSDPFSTMCNCYGSHVLRSLLCICKGVPLDSIEEFHSAKRSVILAERLNSVSDHSDGSITRNQDNFPAVFSYLVTEMMNHAKKDIRLLVLDKYGSFVLQTALRLSVGNVQLLSHAIAILLNLEVDSISEGETLRDLRKEDVMELLEQTASSHLLEVILEVAPGHLYNDFLVKVLKGSLLEISFHLCGNFVVQALISSAKTGRQVEMIWEELGSSFKELLENGKAGVVASLLAACQRFKTHSGQSCESVARAVTSESEYPSFIVPHLLFLDRYVKEKASWSWPGTEKMHTLGCMILQIVFKYPNHVVRQFITSLTSMEGDNIFQTARDSGGSRVLESFLCSDASSKQKHKLIAKLCDRFAELSLHPSSSFTVEKCFSAGSLSLKEAIAAELVAVQAELTKTKHGPYLLKKLDIHGYATRPEQWKSSQKSKVNVYREFQSIFGSKSKVQEQNEDVQHSKVELKQKHTKESPGHDVYMAKLGFPTATKGLKRKKTSKSNRIENGGNKLPKTNVRYPNFTKGPGKASCITELADMAAKTALSAAEVRKLFSPSIKNDHGFI